MYPTPCQLIRLITACLAQTAWWPPTMNQLHDYAAAHFNLLLGGNIDKGCQYNGTIPTPATTTQAFECLAAQLPKMDAVGMKFAWGFGGFNKTNGTEALVAGGAASYGGVTESRPGGYPTASAQAPPGPLTRHYYSRLARVV